MVTPANLNYNHAPLHYVPVGEQVRFTASAIQEIVEGCEKSSSTESPRIRPYFLGLESERIGKSKKRSTKMRFMALYFTILVYIVNISNIHIVMRVSLL